MFTDGETWREHRRFTLSCLRDFGLGKKPIELKIQEEAEFFIQVCHHNYGKLNFDFTLIHKIFMQEIENQRGEAFDPAQMVSKAVCNIISALIYGSRFEYDDKVFQGE